MYLLLLDDLRRQVMKTTRFVYEVDVRYDDYVTRKFEIRIVHFGSFCEAMEVMRYPFL